MNSNESSLPQQYARLIALASEYGRDPKPETLEIMQKSLVKYFEDLSKSPPIDRNRWSRL